jgi:hypothetical protein
MNFLVPVPVVIGSIFSHSAFTSPIGADVNPLNNQATASAIVTGSYDPNEKKVYQPVDLSLGDSMLTYTVYFQNTGTDTAFTVEILDTLDQDLDVGTVEMLEASVAWYDYEWAIEGSNVLRITFPDIRLPDSTINEPLSHGHFSYRIQMRENLPLPIYIDNRASIYFDYNQPILTNTTHNQLVPNAVSDEFANAIQLYPNPSSGKVNIVWKGDLEASLELRVVDMRGQVVHKVTVPEMNGEATAELDLRFLAGGVYIVEMYDGVRTHHKRLVLQR